MAWTKGLAPFTLKIHSTKRKVLAMDIITLLIAAIILIVIFDKSNNLEVLEMHKPKLVKSIIWLTAVMAALPCAGLIVLSAAWLVGAL